MGYWILTKEQRKFLQKHQHEEPFTLIDWTIPKILTNGQYNDGERKKLNQYIELWKKEYRK